MGASLDTEQTTRTGDPEADALATAIERHLVGLVGAEPERAGPRERYLALAQVVREQLLGRWVATRRKHEAERARSVCYLSLEFHLGRLLRHAALGLGIEEPLAQAVGSLGVELEELEEQERDPALASGGLGRLAACFLSSLAALELPAWGYGLRYEFGLFRQVIRDGHQVEEPNDWLEGGVCPWEVPRPELAVRVSFRGRVVSDHDADGRLHFRWVDTDDILAVPHDFPIPGFRTGTVNTLRLWSARPAGPGLDLQAFQRGEHHAASSKRVEVEAITAVLYPNEHTPAGAELRLKQQFLLASATLQDLLRQHARGRDCSQLAERVILQLNDTHPAIAIPELMRLLMDERGLTWQEAWALTTKVFAYTNHTLLPEALETWPVGLLGGLLPRHLQIIEEIDRRFRREALERLGQEERVRRVAIIEGGRVHMANLAVVASGSVNGVSALHTELVRKSLMPDLQALFPERFNNKTNGIDHRRWLRQANPQLSELITSRIGEGWLLDLERLRGLEPLADDPELGAAWRRVKRVRKELLGRAVLRDCGVTVSPDSLFDVQIKRIHEYKRQLLLAMFVIHRYRRMLAEPDHDWVPRTVVFAGKAAIGYVQAKRVIHLIHSIAAVVNADARLRDRLKVAFLPNYSVSLAEVIVPGADLSEQISTAGMEASGTGNMKLTLNGALTIGTLDGANVEIREAVGEDNFFLFGLRAEEVLALRAIGYRPCDYVERDPQLAAVLEALKDGTFSKGDRDVFLPLVHSLLDRDSFMLLADFADYVRTQEQVDALYRQPEAWTRKAILNVARVGRFSSDRTVQEYAREVWHIRPLPVPVR